MESKAVFPKDGTYYKNSVGLDPKIVNKCYVMAKIAHRLKVQ